MDTLVYLKKPLRRLHCSGQRARFSVAQPIPVVTGVAIPLTPPKPEVNFVKLYKECVQEVAGGSSPRRPAAPRGRDQLPQYKYLTRQESTESIVTCYDHYALDNPFKDDVGPASDASPSVDLLYEFDYDNNNEEYWQHNLPGPPQSELTNTPFSAKNVNV